MLCDELEYFSIFEVEWPVPEFLDIAAPDFIHRQELFIMLLMLFEEALLANKSRLFLAVWFNTNVENLPTFVARQKALGGNRPFDFMHFPKRPFGRAFSPMRFDLGKRN